LIGFTNQSKAETEEKRLLIELGKKLERLECQGATWDTVVDRWEYDKRAYPSSDYVETTILDHAALLRKWTRPWLNRIASELNRGDGREILRAAQGDGKKTSFLKKLRNTINVVYGWGIEEKLIVGVHHSPVHGLDVGKEKEGELPEILSLGEIRALLTSAREHDHAWYPVWSMALLTGMRSGELHSLLWTDVEMASEEIARLQEGLPADKRRYGMIRVTKTWNTRTKSTGPTKGGYWRSVPISGELYWLLREQKVRAGEGEYVLPRFWEWDKGEQARVLRAFCLGAGLKSIRFHTLRACFATQLISDGIAPTRVMKIGGWKDIKTMQRYVRMAGIDEAGATEGLKFLPSDEAVMGRVVNLFDFRTKR
jgi:integrase